MKRFLTLVAVIALGTALQQGRIQLDASALTAYEWLFGALGGGTIVFMILVVAAGPSPTALPEAFRPALLPPGGHCLVCNAQAATGTAWVTCTRCAAPYHADCARYLSACAVFGCAKNPPALVEKPELVTRSAEPRSD